MHDSEVVASIVAGDAGGLAEAYDRYADHLYKYCRSMLSEPADAADAVQDTFVIAAARLAGLREPGRLRAWLFAVARNEALRILRARNATPPPAQALDVTADGADVGAKAERAELRELLDDAAAGLNPGEREVIELQLRQGLEPAEVATVLGVSRNHVHSLLSRARDQLEACLAVLLVGRAGQADCAVLASMLDGRDGRLTVPLRKQVHRHIDRCPTCGARRAAELRPAMLLGLSPGAAMAAAAAESLRAAAGPPAALKAHTLALAAGQDPGAVAHRAAVLGRAGSFDGHGFPKPAHGSAGALAHHVGVGGVSGWRGGNRPRGGSGATGRRGAVGGAGVRNVVRGREGRVAAGAGVVLAVVAGALAFALSGNSGQARLADGRVPGAAPSPGTSVSAVAAPGTATATPKHPASRTAAAPTTAPATADSAAASDPPPTLAPTTADPTTPASPRSPTPAPTTAGPPSKPTPPPPAGTLEVFPPGGSLLVPPWGTTIFLGARGGPVTWSATVSPGSGSVTVSPSGGTIAAGGRGTVTITASQSAGGRQVTLYPGGIVYTITVNRGHHPFAS